MRRNLPYYLQHGVLALAFAKAEKSQWHWALRIWGVRTYSECSAVFFLMCAHECMWPPVPLYECAAQITGWIAYYSAALVHFINCSFEMSPEFKARKKEWVSEWEMEKRFEWICQYIVHINGGDPEGPAKDTYFLPSWLSGKVLEPCMVIIQLFHHYGVDYYKNHWQISSLICTSFLRVWPCIMMLLSNFFCWWSRRTQTGYDTFPAVIERFLCDVI